MAVQENLVSVKNNSKQYFEVLQSMIAEKEQASENGTAGLIFQNYPIFKGRQAKKFQ